MVLVAINMGLAKPADRLRAAKVAFRYGASVGIDGIKVQSAFIRDPPGELAEALTRWIKTGRRKGRWVFFERPSVDDIDRSLEASPYLEAVNVLHEKRVLVSVSDAADNLDLELTREEWEHLRSELESILGQPLDYDIEELAREEGNKDAP
jgi:hypothetical protein